jgi:hypothetical protein
MEAKLLRDICELKILSPPNRKTGRDHLTPHCIPFCFTVSFALSACLLSNTTTPCVSPSFSSWGFRGRVSLYTILLNTIMRIMTLLHIYIMFRRYITYIMIPSNSYLQYDAARFQHAQADGAIVLSVDIMYHAKKSVLVTDMSVRG